ncbi:H-type lectin domain-containing protein [Alicyclobacillus suci]|uniref:H-type lectin domain-containing protein n=1 Tax=Alicyclobacillus suci TaxID=2816080 RepID=UPI001A8F96FE|nr:H-type lectin domain-containing protein [Alicyclobacillus suci]
MGVYGNMVITQQGQTLFGKVQTGATLTFTRMQIGSGQLASGQDPTTFTSLISPIDYFNINSVANSGGTAVVRGIYQNTNLTASTYTCEIGLYAQDPDAGEILYAYANAGTQGDTIPPYSDGPYSRQFQINTAVGNATNVTANVPSDAYVTVSEVGQPGGVASLDNNGHVPPDQINISTATTTDPGTVLVSAPPTQGQQPVAVSTTDPVYVNAARKDQANTFSQPQTFNGPLNAVNSTGTDSAFGTTNYSAALGASWSNKNLGGDQYQINGTQEAADRIVASTNSSSTLTNYIRQWWSYAKSAAVLAVDFITGKVSTLNNVLDDGSGNMTVAGNVTAQGHNLLQSLSGGYKVQSGITSFTDAQGGTVTFPTPFSSGCVPLVIPAQNTGGTWNGTNGYQPNISNISNTGFTVSGMGNTNVAWIAIGY